MNKKIIILMFGMILIVLGSLGGFASLTDGLVHWYKFDGNVSDSIGSSDGTINDASLTTGRSGLPNTAYTWDTSDNTKITWADGTFEDPTSTGDYSITIWINKTGDTGTGYGAIFGHSASGQDNMIKASDDETITITTTNGGFSLTTDAINLNEWVSLGFVFDDTSDELKIYINGIENINGTAGSFTDINHEWELGSYVASASNKIFRGSVDGLRIYNRILTDSEVLQIANDEEDVLYSPIPSNQSTIMPNGSDVNLNITIPSEYEGLWNVSFCSNTGNWVENPLDYWVNLTLGDLYKFSTPFAFNKDGWKIVSGSQDGFYEGFQWNGTGWEENSTLVSGLSDIGEYSKPSVFNMNGWKLITGFHNGVYVADGFLVGYQWNGTGWEENSTLVSGIGDVERVPAPTVFNMNGWKMIIGNDDFKGFQWNGTGWEENSTLVSGINNITGAYDPTVFNMNGWKMIIGNGYGYFDGYQWNGTGWSEEDELVVDLDDVGFYSSPTVFNFFGTWKLITGTASKWCRLYEWNNTISITQLNIENLTSTQITWEDRTIGNYPWYVTLQNQTDVITSSVWDFEVRNPTLLFWNMTNSSGGQILNYTININGEDIGNTTNGNYTYYNFPYNISTPIIIKTSDYAWHLDNVTLIEDGNYSTNAFLPTNTLNITFYDETSRNILNFTTVYLELISDAYSSNHSTTNGKITASGLIPIEYNLRFWGDDGYNLKNYYFTLTNNTFNNLKLYLSNTSVAVSIKVYDQYGMKLESVDVKLLRHEISTGTYTIVEIGRTNFEGETQLQAELNTALYKFILEYEGEQVKVTEGTYIYSQNLEFVLSIGSIAAQYFFNSNGVLWSLVFNEITNKFIYTYNDPNNLVEQGCLKVYRIRATRTTLDYSQCVSGSAGSIEYEVNNISGALYRGTAHIGFSPSEYFLGEKLQEFMGEDVGGSLGLLGIILVTIVFMAFGFWNIIVALILFPLPLLFGSLSNIVGIGVPVAIAITITSWLLAFILSKHG